MIISICIAPSVREYKALVRIITVSGKSSQSFRLKGATGQLTCTPYQHLDCNIFLDRYLPDALRSTKQLRLSILTKDTNTLAL